MTENPATHPDVESSPEPPDQILEPTSLRNIFCNNSLKHRARSADSIRMAKTPDSLDASLRFQLSLLRLTQQSTLRSSVKPGNTDAANQLAELTTKASGTRAA